MADIDLDTLVYRDTEVDALMAVEATRVDTAIALKADANKIGSPSGIASLDTTGKHTAVEIPFSSNAQSVDETNEVAVINPKTLDYALTAKTVLLTEKGIANGVVPLDAASKIDSSYLPSDFTDNTVDIATNMADIATNTADIATNTADISTNTANIATNASDIADNVTDIGTNTAAIAANVIDIATNTSDIADNTADIVTLTSTTGTQTTNIATNTSDISGIQDTLGVITTLDLGATGFDLRLGQETSQGTLEYCLDASSGIMWSIDHNQVSTKYSGRTYFLDGTTALADRTMGIGPSSGEANFSYYFNGAKVTKTAFETYQHPNTTAKHIYCFDENGDIALASGIYQAVMQYAIFGLATINVINTEKVVFGSERHGLQMDSTTHKMMHETQGAVWSEGLLINDLTNNGTTYSSIDSGVFYDEDIEHVVGSTTNAPFAWREGVAGPWRVSSTVDTDLGFMNGGSIVQYNLYTPGTDTWSLASIAAGYVIMHFFATNDAEYPIFKVVGQNLYGSRNDARDALYAEYDELAHGTLPTPEFLHIGCMIIHNSGTGQIETGSDGEIWVDTRHHYIPRY